jgi:hypothetical protein
MYIQAPVLLSKVCESNAFGRTLQMEITNA